PSVDYFGGERKGRNEYGNSVVAIEAGTGKILWHFQTVRHDLWDYDNASPPALVTLTVGGRLVPAVLQATKTGQLFALDRQTGSSGLPPLSPQTFTRDQLWGPTPEAKDACRKRYDELRYNGAFTPPSIRGSLILPSNVGGAHWGGIAFDPSSDVVVVPTNRIAAVITLIPRADFEAMRGRQTTGERIGTEYAVMRGTPFVLKREL